MIDFHPLPSNPDELTAEHARLVFGDAATVTRIILAAVLEWQSSAAPS